MKIWNASAQERFLWTNERSGPYSKSMTRRNCSWSFTIYDVWILCHQWGYDGKENRVSGLDQVFGPEQLQHGFNCERSEVTAVLNVTLKNNHHQHQSLPPICKVNNFQLKCASRIQEAFICSKWQFLKTLTPFVAVYLQICLNILFEKRNKHSTFLFDLSSFIRVSHFQTISAGSQIFQTSVFGVIRSHGPKTVQC